MRLSRRDRAPGRSGAASSIERLAALGGLAPRLGFGPSRVVARACAECGLEPAQFGAAAVRWLWPEEEEVVARLHRLGLATIGAVAALPENVLVDQLGRKGRLAWRRAHGRDLSPLRPRYPPPRVRPSGAPTRLLSPSGSNLTRLWPRSAPRQPDNCATWEAWTGGCAVDWDRTGRGLSGSGAARARAGGRGPPPRCRAAPGASGDRRAGNVPPCARGGVGDADSGHSLPV